MIGVPTGYITLRDEKGVDSTMSFHIDKTMSLDNVSIYIDELIGIVTTMTDGEFISAGFSVEVSRGTGIPGASAGSDVQEKVLFSFRTETSGATFDVTIPTIKEGIFQDASVWVDETDPLVTAFLDAAYGHDLTGAGGTGEGKLADNRGEAVLELGLIQGREAWGKFRRPTSRPNV